MFSYHVAGFSKYHSCSSLLLNYGCYLASCCWIIFNVLTEAHMCVYYSLSHIQLFGTPMGCSLSGSSVHGVPQARISVWVATLFSRGFSRPRDQTQVSYISGRFFTVSATREAQGHMYHSNKFGFINYFDNYVTLCAVLSRSVTSLCDPMDCSPPGSLAHGDSPGKNIGVDCHALLQGIFPTQGSNQVSHIAGGFFIIWATCEAQEYWRG